MDARRDRRAKNSRMDSDALDETERGIPVLIDESASAFSIAGFVEPADDAPRSGRWSGRRCGRRLRPRAGERRV